jgi:hypothetical protein
MNLVESEDWKIYLHVSVVYASKIELHASIPYCIIICHS